MYFSQRFFLFAFLVAGAQYYVGALEISDFYEYDRSIRLENGDNQFEIIKLDTPIHFFSDTFDTIYVSIHSGRSLNASKTNNVVCR